MLQHRFGVPLVIALAIAAVFPLGDIVSGWYRTRRLQPLGALMLVVLTTGIVASLISGDVHFALMKESAATLLVSAIFLLSLLGPRPMVFLLGRQFSTGGDRAKMAEWDKRWDSPRFRRSMRILTAGWGLGYLADAVARGVATYTLSPNVVVVLSPISMIAVTLLLVAWTASYARRAQRTETRAT